VVTDIWTEIDLILRLFAGMAAGVIVGWERTLKQKSAGIRTVVIVGLGTATAAAIFTGEGQADAASRVVQGVLTGIGFLGVGVITLSRADRMPRRLTTAAAIWLTASLGCAAGSCGRVARDRQFNRALGRPGRGEGGRGRDCRGQDYRGLDGWGADTVAL
jgi:uncharacterized membrane protein YhiD involved in acid resistance